MKKKKYCRRGFELGTTRLGTMLGTCSFNDYSKQHLMLNVCNC